MKRHNKNAPPDGIVDVHYEMELVHILGIDELKQTMTALVYVDEVLYQNDRIYLDYRNGSIQC